MWETGPPYVGFLNDESLAPLKSSALMRFKLNFTVLLLKSLMNK